MQPQSKTREWHAVVQTYLPDLCLRLGSHVLKKLRRPVYESLHVQGIIWQGPPATSAVAIKAALHPLHEPATGAVPICCGRNMKVSLHSMRYVAVERGLFLQSIVQRS